VYYWYQSHERVVASEYWGKVFTVVDAIRHNRTDAALVRVTVRARDRSDQATRDAQEAAADFVKALFPLLRNHLPS
jgi:EpsI family protein